MIHDPALTDYLAGLPQERFDGVVFRATRKGADPTAPSITGGRWAPRPNADPGVSVLYTSLERDGAIAEVASYLAEQNPRPAKPLKVHELAITTSRTLRLVRASLIQLRVDPRRYGERNYAATQRIGAAVNFLGFDGLIAPSARWACDNLMIFAENHGLNETLEIRRADEIDWQSWWQDKGPSTVISLA